MRLGLLCALTTALLIGCGSSDSGSGASDPTLTTFGADGGDPGSSSSSSSSSGSSGDITSSSSSSSSSSSGSSGSSGTPTTGCSGSAADPAAATTVSGYLDKLPYGNPTGTTRAAIIDAIIKSCAEFGPTVKESGYAQNYCWAHLASAIEKESSYGVNATVLDSYGTRTTTAGKANDPTVGLLQIRFSSTVHDMIQSGNTAAMACIGCNLPASFATHKTEDGDSAFWAVSGPSANMSTMENVACNVGMGAWYYYQNATSNGKASAATYLAAYCSGSGTAANLITGLRSHLEGPDGGKGVIANQAALNGLQSTDGGAYDYVTSIKTWFDSMVGPVSGTHPFFMTLAPNNSQYCD